MFIRVKNAKDIPTVQLPIKCEILQTALAFGSYRIFRTISEMTEIDTIQAARSDTARYFISTTGTVRADFLKKNAIVKMFPTMPISIINAAGTTAGIRRVDISVCSVTSNPLSIIILKKVIILISSPQREPVNIFKSGDLLDVITM
jgi:hypothetical protein